MLLKLDAIGLWLLAYCALNTLVAYGAFAEALAHWEASRVSTILATTPLLSLGVIALVHGLCRARSPLNTWARWDMSAPAWW